MYGNAPATKKTLDRRIRRTRERLGDALIELIQEKPFDSVTVQDVLDRASIGRSTFYAHYRDKNDLLVSDMDEFLELMATWLARRDPASDRVAPVRELFAHVGEQRRLWRALVASGRIADFMELARGHFARSIEQRLAVLPRARGVAAEQRAAVAYAHAGALLSLLSWWLDRGMQGTPEAMDELYHRLVWTGAGDIAAPRGR